MYVNNWQVLCMWQIYTSCFLEVFWLNCFCSFVVLFVFMVQTAGAAMFRILQCIAEDILTLYFVLFLLQFPSGFFNFSSQ